MKKEDITPDFLRRIYLFGINLQDMYGNQMTDELLQHYIDSAIEQTERQFHILLSPTRIDGEMHDYYQSDYRNWGYIQLTKRPIKEVHSLNMAFGDMKVFTIPQDWIRFDPLSAQLQLFPMSGSTGGMLLTSNGAFIPYTMGLFQYTPQIWRSSYTAGFDEIPSDLLEYICKKSSIGVLQIWGDLILGAGIANQTISLDGLSQSIGTTQSPEFSGAGARIKNYTDDIARLDKLLSDNYVGLNVVVV